MGLLSRLALGGLGAGAGAGSSGGEERGREGLAVLSCRCDTPYGNW